MKKRFYTFFCHGLLREIRNATTIQWQPVIFHPPSGIRHGTTMATFWQHWSDQMHHTSEWKTKHPIWNYLSKLVKTEYTSLRHRIPHVTKEKAKADCNERWSLTNKRDQNLIFSWWYKKVWANIVMVDLVHHSIDQTIQFRPCQSS